MLYGSIFCICTCTSSIQLTYHSIERDWNEGRAYTFPFWLILYLWARVFWSAIFGDRLVRTRPIHEEVMQLFSKDSRHHNVAKQESLVSCCSRCANYALQFSIQSYQTHGNAFDKHIDTQFIINFPQRPRYGNMSNTHRLWGRITYCAFFDSAVALHVWKGTIARQYLG